MATDSGGRLDEVKTQFAAREGVYKLSSLSEYSRPNRTNYADGGNSPVAVSFTELWEGSDIPDKVCFNIGKEIYVYPFKGLRKAADLTLPTDKRVYKGTFPTCHAFSELPATGTDDPLLLLVGFSAGQIQLIDPIHHQTSLLFNQERAIDKTRVTCVQWVPSVRGQFIVSYASGSMYIYNHELQCPTLPPTYQVFKQGEHHVIFTSKAKSSRNPMFKWIIGDGAIYQFKFSPCKQYLAVVSQDGFLRVFDFNRMELVGYMKSYFGGLHCVSWSPDGKYIATGGEDDLITVYSFHENRVICRGRGHRSWVTAISFDPYTTLAHSGELTDYPSDDESLGRTPMTSKNSLRESTRSSTSSRYSVRLDADGSAIPLTTYRIGSVSQDTNLCLWDITSDVLNSHLNRNRTNSYIARNSLLEISTSSTTNTGANNTSTVTQSSSLSSTKSNSVHPGSVSTPNLPNASLPSPQPSIGNGTGTKAKRNFSLGYKDKSSLRSTSAAAQILKNNLDQRRVLGSQWCPRLHEIPLLEPLTCKKLSQNMLTSIHFYKDFLVISSQDGVVSSYARPHRQLIGNSSSHEHPENHVTSNHVSTSSGDRAGDRTRLYPQTQMNGHDSIDKTRHSNSAQW